MSKYIVEITGVNTNDLPVLRNEEQIRLFEEMHRGNNEAKNKLVEGNLKLVLSVLKGYKQDKHNMDDLFQAGVVGLIKAIDNFDLSYNLKLSTYAIPLIVGEIKRYHRENSTSLRVSRGIKDFAYQILHFKDEYSQKEGIEPSIDIIASHFKCRSYEIGQALDSLKEPVSIYEPIFNDGGEPIYLYDQIEDKRTSEKDNLLLMKKSLSKLKERERTILLNRYIIGKTQIEIADALSISQAQVSRIEKSAIKTLKRIMK